MKHVMIDLETLATTADAVILSIGAVRFDLETGDVGQDYFYRSISIDSNLGTGRRISESTLKWWMKQSAEAQQVFHDEEKHCLLAALLDLRRWFNGTESIVWSNGADFDLPILTHACTQTGVQIPWEFWNTRCLRTYRNLPGAKAVAAPNNEMPHNALNDAIEQAEHACAIHRALFGQQVPA